MKKNESPTIAVLRHLGLPVTFENWLGMNELTDKVPHAEMLEVVPARFQKHYMRLLEAYREQAEQFDKAATDSKVTQYRGGRIQ